MLGASAICEHAIANQGVLFFGVSEQSGISSSANAGVGIMSGVSTLIPAFTQTSTGTFISSGANAVDIIPYIVVAANRIALGTPQLAFG